ncbi:MAG: DUF2336 domain-containing protein [Pseudomonadota bacterium]
MDLALDQDQLPSLHTRHTLLRRLIDVVSMPSSSISSQERSVAGDILLEMLFSASNEERIVASSRLAEKQEAPPRVLRYLASCEISVARHVLEENVGLDDGTLVRVVHGGSIDHRMLVAERKVVPQLVSSAIIERGDFVAVAALLKNRGASICDSAMDALMALSQMHLPLCDLLINRPELTPAHALAMFWWADTETREKIMRRNTADRIELIQRCEDIFALAAADGWSDPVARKTLQLIERRQRNRAAISRSPFDHLEHAIEVAFRDGMEPSTAQEIGYLAGIKPVTIAKILSDKGGEGMAVLCKATGLKRSHLAMLYESVGRPLVQINGDDHPVWHQVREIFEILSTAKAQTTLRYWNWSLSSTFSPQLGSVVDPADTQALNHSIAQRTASLVFNQ